MNTQRSILRFGVGLTVGLLIGLGMVIGTLLTTGLWQIGGANSLTTVNGDSSTLFPKNLETRLHALGSHGGTSFSLATGPVDDGVEGIFTLDFLTGELNCRVFDTQNAAFLGQFKYTNVMADLQIDKDKKPSFAMVTGQVNFQRGGGSARPASSVVYIADCNSGNVMAYGLSWNRTLSKSHRPQVGTLQRLGGFKGRSVAIRSE